MALLYGRAGRLTAQNGAFWPGQKTGGLGTWVVKQRARKRAYEKKGASPPCISLSQVKQVGFWTKLRARGNDATPARVWKSRKSTSPETKISP
jgi:hypothetical protein